MDKLRDAVFLLAVEQPNGNTRWPVATACAVGENLLLTSGSVATRLAGYQKKGFKLWAINEPLGISSEVQKLSVRARFQPSAGPPEVRIYFDLAILTVSDKLTKLATVAELKEIKDLEDGFPMGCVDMDIPPPDEVEALNRFQHYKPELLRCSIFKIFRSSPPDGPWLLLLKGELNPKPYGGFLVGQDAKVYAVYAETAEPEPDGGLVVQLPVVLRDLLTLDSNITDSKLWVAPAVPEAAPQETPPQGDQ